MAIRKASAQTAVNRGASAAAATTTNQITIAPATVTTVSGGGSLGGGTISNVSIMSDATYTTVLSGDTAVSTSGGFIRITGTGFKSGANVFLGSTLLTNTFVSSTRINAVVPAIAAGNYNLFVFNPDNTGVAGPTVNTSGFPTFTQTSYTSNSLSLGIQLLATGDGSLLFYLAPGSANPQNLSVNGSGLITGTVSEDGVYTLTVIVDDAQSQSTQATITIAVTTNDPYFNLTTLALPGNGSNNANNHSFTDSSSNIFAITRSGNATQGTFSPFSQTGWSVFFGTNGDYAQTPNTTLPTTQSTFTIEGWIYPTATPVASTNIPSTIFDGNPVGGNLWWGFGIVPNRTLSFYWWTGATNSVFGNTVIPLHTWTHIAVSVSSNTIRLFVNGVQQTLTGTTTLANRAGSEGITVFAYWNNASIYTGYVSNFSILSGTAKYINSFTPPTAPLARDASTQVLLWAYDNRFDDFNTATTAKSIQIAGTPSIQAFSPFAPTAAYSAATVGGSGYFDGSGDFLTVPSNTAFEFGSGNFTMEFSVYGTSTVTSKTFLQYGQAAVTGWTQISWGFGTDASNFPFLEVSNGVNGPQFSITSNTALRLNEWNHIAVVRSGTDFRIYLNGVSVASTTSSFSLFAPGGTVYFWIARAHDNATSRDVSGYMSNLRVVKGTAVYTGAFTPPRAPLATSGAASASAYSSTTNVNTSFAASATSLLLNFTNAGITDATAKNVLETVGDAKISTTQSKFGGTSMYFDGTGDRLDIRTTPNVTLGSGDFTLEGWLYLNSVSGSQIIFDQRPATAQGVYPVLYMNNAVMTWYISLTATITSSNLSTATWYHFAICRSGTSTRMFINGVQDGSTYTDSNNYLASRTYIGISAFDQTGGLNGYIDDFRITKGFARYTANFTPPTLANPLR